MMGIHISIPFKSMKWGEDLNNWQVYHNSLFCFRTFARKININFFNN
jgi:hypothetical protein